MGKLKVTIEHGNSSSQYVFLIIATVAALALVSSVAAPLVIAVGVAGTVVVGILKVLGWILAGIAVAILLKYGWDLSSSLKDTTTEKKTVEEFRKRERERTLKAKGITTADQQKWNAELERTPEYQRMLVESKRLDRNEA